MQPHPSPRGHHVHSDILPEPAFFGAGFVFRLLELGTEGMLEPPVRISLAVADEVHVDVVGVADIDVCQEPIVAVAGFDRLQAQRDGFAIDPCAKVVRRTLGPVRGAIGRRVVHLGGINAEQSNDRIVRFIRVDVDRVAIDDPADGKRAVIETRPVVLGLPRCAEVIPTGERRQRKDQKIAAGAEEFPLAQGTGEMDALTAYFTFSSSNASCTN